VTSPGPGLEPKPDPDPRWTMANERTALAWVRTALALVAGGVGLTSVARLAKLSRAIEFAAAGVCLLGAWAAVAAYIGWRQRDRAMRRGEPVPANRSLAYLTGITVVLGVAVSIYLVFSTT
jgi:putative membrane protein